MGSVRLTERFIAADPPDAGELRRDAREIGDRPGRGRARRPRIHDARTFVAVAGTATTIQAIALGLERYDPEAIHRSWLSRRGRRAGRGRARRDDQRRASGDPRDGSRARRRDRRGRRDPLGVIRRFGFERTLVSETDILQRLGLRTRSASGSLTADAQARPETGSSPRSPHAVEQERDARSAGARSRSGQVGAIAAVVLVIALGVHDLATRRRATPPTPRRRRPCHPRQPGKAEPAEADGDRDGRAEPPGEGGVRRRRCPRRRRRTEAAVRPDAPTVKNELEKNTDYTAVMRDVLRDDHDRAGRRRGPADRGELRVPRTAHYFDGHVFHRVVDSIDVVQGGDPTGTGGRRPGLRDPRRG